ncbi:MAG: Gfo/Idh/MocA family oxidoreductase [Acidimicrobiia bacterium]
MNRFAVVGCGMISRTYGYTLGMFDWVELAACADVFPERAEERAEKWGARAMSVEAVLEDPEIDAIVNLTPPKMHADVDRAALTAGKAVFSEKPLGITFEEGTELVDLAAGAGLRLGCAPDTFLGAGLQACRGIIDRGDIGEPLAANAFMLSPGPERWHPSPAIFYERGAGPLFDMGPYYFTALVQLLGPARRITAMGRRAREQREITSEPLAGTMIDVEVPTHVSSLVEFESGTMATLVTSFDAQASNYRCIEVYGSEATLSVPDPNSFGGPVSIKRRGEEGWTEVELPEPNLPQFRGIGFAEMLWAQRSGRPHRASAELALHVLELMSAAITSTEQHRAVDVETTCDRAMPLPVGLPENTYDD